MDSFELNKILGAILGTLLFVMGVGFLAEAIYHPIEDRGPGYPLPEPELVAQATVPEDGGGETVPAGPALGTLLASANVEAGVASSRKCQACHTFDESGANRAGPGLYGVVGRVIGSHEGFAYSEAMQAHATAGDTWTYEELDAFIEAPRDHIPGTKMGFGGIKDAAERANLLAYLQTLSPSPVPFPAAAAEAVPVDNAVATPTTTPGETAVEGTPTTSGPGASEPAAPAEAAPAAETPAAEAPAAEAPAAAGSELATLLASASVERGTASSRKCQACHTFDESGANRAGPGLYGVVGRVTGTHEGFNYSPAMQALATAGHTWTYAELDAFIEAPRTHVPGTKMGFGGIKDPAERADLLAYLQTLSPEPVPFPAP